MNASLRPWRLALIVSTLVVAADQTVKAVIATNIAPGGEVDLTLGVELVSVRNRGIAFGLLGGADAGLVLALTLVALVVLAVVFAREPSRPGGWLAVGLLAGGALGNLADRVRDGAVVDYLNLPFWPAFNLADAAITIGIALLLLGGLQRGEHREPDSPGERSPPDADATGAGGAA